ncbi:MAG: hypothetical protein U0470_04815 [Anaerolineae bacterium]
MTISSRVNPPSPSAASHSNATARVANPARRCAGYVQYETFATPSPRGHNSQPPTSTLPTAASATVRTANGNRSPASRSRAQRAMTASE